MLISVEIRKEKHLLLITHWSFTIFSTI